MSQVSTEGIKVEILIMSGTNLRKIQASCSILCIKNLKGKFQISLNLQLPFCKIFGLCRNFGHNHMPHVKLFPPSKQEITRLVWCVKSRALAKCFDSFCFSAILLVSYPSSIPLLGTYSVHAQVSWCHVNHFQVLQQQSQGEGRVQGGVNNAPSDVWTCLQLLWGQTSGSNMIAHDC